MCKKQRLDNDQNKATNIGIVNLSNEAFGSSINAETIMEAIGLFILVLLAVRWIRKCCVKRKLKQRRQLQSLIQNGGGNFGNQVQPAAQILPLPAQPAQAINMRPVGADRQLSLESQEPPREIWTQAQ